MGRRMPREQIDGSAFAVDGERDFESDVPAEGRQETGGPPDESRVTLVQKPIERAAPPPHVQQHFRVECGQDSLKLPDGHRVDLTTFDPRNEILAHACQARDIVLAPTEVMT